LKAAIHLNNSAAAANGKFLEMQYIMILVLLKAENMIVLLLFVVILKEVMVVLVLRIYLVLAKDKAEDLNVSIYRLVLLILVVDQVVAVAILQISLMVALQF
jgi:hypothetical protein